MKTMDWVLGLGLAYVGWQVIFNRSPGAGGTLAAAKPIYPVRGIDRDDFTVGFDLREDPRWYASSLAYSFDPNSGEYTRPNY